MTFPSSGLLPRLVASGFLATLVLAPSAAAQGVKVSVSAEPSTVYFDPATGRAGGTITVTLDDRVPSGITLRALPLGSQGARAFVTFNQNGDKDLIRLDNPSLTCMPSKSCSVAYEVSGTRAPGTYTGAIDAYDADGRVASTPVAAVLAPYPFAPIVGGEAMKDGHLSVDATSKRTFLLTIRNPADSLPTRFALAGKPIGFDGCGKPPWGPVEFSPARFRLDAGAEQVVIGTLGGCVPLGTSTAVLDISDQDRPERSTDAVISISRYEPLTERQSWLFLFVLLGSTVSVMLNNIFPLGRAKHALRGELQRVRDTLRDCQGAGAAVVDSLASEVKRTDLLLRGIHSWDPAKLNAAQEAQRSIEAAAAAAAAARQISMLRSKIEGAAIPLSAAASMRTTLLDAEAALIGGDAAVSQDRLQQAALDLKACLDDVNQTSTKAMLVVSVPKLLDEHPDTASRSQRVKAVFEQLADDVKDLDTYDAQDLLDTEREYHVAQIWAEYVERKVDEDAKRFEKSAAAIENLLFRNPKSELTLSLVDLIRADTSLEELEQALADRKARIRCELRPQYFQPVNVAFEFTDAALHCVAAAPRVLSYEWTIDDGTHPPDVERFSHFFQPGSSAIARYVRYRFGEPSRTPPLKVSVSITVPFGTKAYAFEQVVTPRTARGGAWTSFPTELASFLLTTAVAVVTAFGAHYGGGIPDQVGWPDCLTSFMLGFGLDQLRDRVSTPAAPMPGQPSVAPSPASRPPSAPFPATTGNPP